jgi:DNA-binding response OmpR family regulator
MESRTIVVVEDDERIAAAVAARLRAEGFRVETAATGPDGVELCRRVAPELVVLDWMLPGFDGVEVCRRSGRCRSCSSPRATPRPTCSSGWASAPTTT